MAGQYLNRAPAEAPTNAQNPLIPVLIVAAVPIAAVVIGRLLAGREFDVDGCCIAAGAVTTDCHHYHPIFLRNSGEATLSEKAV